MAQADDPQHHPYPTGRGYGHDYMRGGEVLGGYGYSARAEYERRRGDHGHSDEPNLLERDADAVKRRPQRQSDSESRERATGAPRAGSRS